MKESYRPLAGLAGGFLLAIAIVAAVSLSQTVKQPATTAIGPSSSGQKLIASNNTSGRSPTWPGPNASTTPQTNAGPSNIQTMARQGAPSILITVTPLLVAIVLGIGVHQLSMRRVEREE